MVPTMSGKALCTDSCFEHVARSSNIYTSIQMERNRTCHLGFSM